MSDDSSVDFGSDSGGDYGGGSGSVTETSTTGWLQRILGSIVGAILGIGLLIGSVMLLWWNEGRAVDAIRALDQGSRQVVEITAAASVNPATEGKLVHLSGTMESHAAVHDSIFRLGGDNLLRLKRNAEMYQWTEHKSTHSHKNLGGSETTETTYSYEKEWSRSAVDLARFHEPNNHHNPSMPIFPATFDTDDARIGAYRVDRLVLEKVDAFTPYGTQNAELPSGYRRAGDTLYRGQDEHNPTIGDIRVHFDAVPSQSYSVVAMQSSGGLAPYHAANGYTIALADAGTVPAATMLKEKAHEEALWTWLWRLVGFSMMLVGFALISSPLAVLVGFIPFLEEIVGTAIAGFAVVLSVPLTFTVIAVAWISHRPLIGGGLILFGLAAGAYLMNRLHRRRLARPAPVQQPKPAPMQQPLQRSALQRAAAQPPQQQSVQSPLRQSPFQRPAQPQPPQQPAAQPTHFLPPGHRVD